MKTLIKFILLALAVGLASSKDSIPSSTATVSDYEESAICSTECTDGISNSILGLDENKKYGYLFSGKTTIIAPTGTEEGISEVSINGTFNVIGTQKCGAILYFKQIKITQGSKTYNDADLLELKGYPVMFSYNNGKVGRNICTVAQESTASMNLKRAIISALQVSSTSGDQNELFESDVQGTCNTSYSSASSDSLLTITKQKDLTQCTGYDKINLLGLSSAQSLPNYEDSPFSAAVQRSEIYIKKSTLIGVKNEQTFHYQPFGSIDEVTEIKVFMSLKLVKLSTSSTPSYISTLSKSRSIRFEKPAAIIGTADANELIAATKLALQNLQPVVDMDGAKSFSDLIQLLKVAKKDDILSVFQMIVNSGGQNDDVKIAETVFIDALMAANSGESVEAVVELIDSHKLSDSLTISWFNSLANAKYPTKEAVVKASNLLNDRPFKEGYLGVGALLRQYLKDTQDYHSPEVENTLRNLGNPLKKGGSGSLSANDEDLMIASLKGLGNAQYINSDLEDLIIQVIMDRNTIQRIKTAALTMLKTYAKNSKVEKACEIIFTNTSEDSELRILAFKVFAMNPSNYKAAVIKNVLDNKKSQLQIRAYLLSYLSNLQNTVDENKLDQKRFYEGIKTMSSKKTLNDILRYSQSLEYYHQCPLIHSGVLLNSDVIYSYNSFLPRSSSTSLKAFIFGREQEIFDVDVRIENLEPLLEKLFGPEGYFAKSKGSNIDEVRNYLTQAINYAKNKGQNGVDSESSSKQTSENMPEDEMKKIYVDIALKLFGNDLGWFAFQGLESKITYEHIIDAILNNFDNSVPDKKNIEFNVSKRIPIIDFDKQYATCSGLPVSLKIQATSAIKFNIATLFDLESYLTHPENANFALKLIPSGSVIFNTILTVDGYTVDAGYKISSSVHTSTGSDFSLKTVQEKGFEMVYKLPLNVMDILTIKSGAFSIVQEKGNSLVEKPFTSTDVQRKSYTRTFEQFNKTLGLSFHVSYDYSWDGELKSLLPLYGPSFFSLKIFKVDENLTKYVVKGNYDFKSTTLKYIKFIFVTPHADIKRGLELVIAYDTRAHKKLLAQLKTPFTKSIIQGTFVDSDEQKTIEVQYIDGSQHIFNVGVKCEEVDPETIKYLPILEAKYSKDDNSEKQRHYILPMFEIDGYVLVKRNLNAENMFPSKLTLRDIAVVTENSRHSLQGSLAFENNQVIGDASLTTGSITINMNGLISGDYPIFKLDGNLDMTRNVQAEQQLQTDDDKPISKALALLNKIKTLKLFTSQKLHIEAPFVFLSTNHIHWNDDYIEANCDMHIENRELTMHGNVSASNLLDMAFNANITILPITEDSGMFVHGLMEHSLVSDQSNAGYGDFKYVQSKDKKSSYFELNSEDPQTFGKYHLSTKHQSTDDLFKYTLLYDTYSGSNLTVDMNILTDDITLNIQFDSPNPEYKFFIITHGLLETGNTYSLDTKVLWPGDQNSNYLNANGKILLNGHQSYVSGDIDFPLANLVNAHFSVESNSNPEIEDGGIATVRCISNSKDLLSEKFKYKLSLNDGELYLSGESISDESQNVKPISFEVMIKNYSDEENHVGKQIAYKIALEHNNQQLTYQKLLQFTKHTLNFRQLHKIDDDEQKIIMDLKYDIINVWNWSYNLKSKINSPRIFHYLINDDQNALEFDSHIIFGDYSLDAKHTLQIYASEDLTDSYELKWFTNREKTVFKSVYKQREIRAKARYSLNQIEGGHHFDYSGDLWLDFIADPTSKSTLSIDTKYSLKNGLSTTSDVQIYVPLFNDKEMGVKTEVQMFQNWNNPFSVKLKLDIFATTEQSLNLYTSLNRDVQDDGVLYSALLLAQSEGMHLDYGIKDSIFVSKEKWGKYLDAHLIEFDDTKRPVQLHFELMSRGFTNKINIFDVAVIDVDSSIVVKDGALNSLSNVNYNGRKYSFDVLVTSSPSFKYLMGWENKTGSHEQLMVEGSITMDDSAVISATLIQNNGKDVMPVGTMKKSLDKENWWGTNSQISSDQLNTIWQSLKGQFIEVFINVHGNIQKIMSVAKNQRKLRFIEARKAEPQYPILIDYTIDEWNQIMKEIWEDDYILELPVLMLNTTEAILSEVIDFIGYNIDSVKNLEGHMKNYLSKIYKYYAEHANVLLNKLERNIEETFDQAMLTLLDLFKILDTYTDEPVNDMQSSEPRSVKDYYNNVINKFMKAIEKLEDTINHIKDITEDYVKSLPIYDLLRDQIEKLKSYPYKEKLLEEIHKYLQELEMSAPTRDFASFINALDKYINSVVRDIPVSQREIVTLRNKGLIVVKSMIFDFSNYVDHDRAMNIYNALRKLTNFGLTILHIASPNTFQYPNNDNAMLIDFNKYNIPLYRSFSNPSSLIPPYDVQSVIIDSNNIITYNSQPYSFMPNTGSYMLAEDFINNKFSILAYYNNNVLTKISISSHNGDKYELHSGGTITVNGKDVGFPQKNENFKTWRDVYLFGIDINVGVSIKCTLNFNILQVFINGYYYGHVHGLLGAMYQEPRFDFKLPNGKISKDIASFLSAYQLTADAEPTVVDLVKADQPPCPSLFSGISPLKSVFPTVAPAAYRQICNQIVSSATSDQDRLDKACLVAKAYVSMARNNLISSCDIPDMCITSSVHERTIDASTNVKISDSNDVADIMILFEEVVEVEKIFSELLNPLMKKVTSYFNNKGINDVKFILIGYSGKPTDSEVHMYTANEEDGYTQILSNVPEWTESQTVTTDAETKKLPSQLINSFNKVMGKNSKDKAYKLSADYPFRVNAAKVVLSFAQTLYNTNSSALDVSQYTFSYVTSSYMKQGITFYLIAPINLSDASDDGIFGASGGNVVYTDESPNGKNSDEVYTCDESLETDLVLKTGGTMYDSRVLADTTSAQVKTFLRSLCRTVVKTTIDDSTVERSCYSSLYDGVMPYTKCVIVTK